MEAATPLRPPHVRTIGDRVVIDGLVVEDRCAVRLVREREGNGDDPVTVVRDAVEIGARVLDREQAAANAEFVKTEFEKASKDVQVEFADKARTIAEFFENQFAAVFGEDDGQLAKELERRFGDGSAVSVQNRVREAVADTLTKSREDLVRQFSSADDRNPLADFKTAAVRSINEAAGRSDATQRALLQKLGELQKELQALRDEKDKLEEVGAEREKGTAKGRTFEESVFEALDRIALSQGDIAEAVGDRREATGKVGDVVVALDGCNGPARGRVVIEAKDRKLSTPGALSELDRAMAERSADFAVLVVPTEEEVPAKLEPLREYNGDKLVVALDPESGTLPLELGYRLARARVLMKRSDADGIDSGALRDTVERALGALAEERKVKHQLTGAKTSIDKAYDMVEAMAGRVRAHLQEIDILVRPAEEGAAAAAAALRPVDDDQLAL
jgi:DNA-binding TFAR19-related protein (PDSD5 family)